MNISNKHIVSLLADAVEVTNDADAATGNQSPLWVALAPDFGVTPTTNGNIDADDGAAQIDSSTFIMDGQCVRGLWRIKLNKTLVAAKDNYIKIPISAVKLNNPSNILNILFIGFADPTAAGVVGAFSGIGSPIAAFVSKTQKSIVVVVPAANVDLCSGKVLNFEVLYLNK